MQIDADLLHGHATVPNVGVLALPITVTSYKISGSLTAVGSRKQVPPSLESNQYAIQESI